MGADPTFQPPTTLKGWLVQLEQCRLHVDWMVLVDGVNEQMNNFSIPSKPSYQRKLRRLSIQSLVSSIQPCCFTQLLEALRLQGGAIWCLLSPEIGQLWAEIASQMWPLMWGLGMLLLAPFNTQHHFIARITTGFPCLQNFLRFCHVWMLGHIEFWWDIQYSMLQRCDESMPWVEQSKYVYVFVFTFVFVFAFYESVTYWVGGGADWAS